MEEEGKGKEVIDKPTLVVEPRLPLFLPDSREESRVVTTPGLTDETTVKDEDQTETQEIPARREDEGEQLATQNLLPSPEPSLHERSPSPGSSAYASAKGSLSPVKSQASTAQRFSPPATPTPESQQVTDPWLEEPELEYASRTPSPAPTSPIRRHTPIIDVSQLIPSQFSQAQPEPSPQPPTPKSSHQSHVTTPKTTRVDPHITSSEEAAHITAQLTTLSEPESSEDEDEDGEDADDEDEIDELLPSEPPYSQEQSLEETFTTAGDQTVTLESSIQTFTSVIQEKDSIQSFETVETVSGDGIVDDIQIEGVQEQEEAQMEVDVDQPVLEAQEDHAPSPHPQSPPQSHPSPQHESLPRIELELELPQVEQQEDVIMHSTPVVSPVKARSRPNPVTPVALPDYVSPVNTPSPSRSPFLSRGLGSRRGGTSRKRKWEDMTVEVEDPIGQPQSKSKSQSQAPCIEVITRDGRKMGSPGRTSVKIVETPTPTQARARPRPESPLAGRTRPRRTSNANTSVLSSPSNRRVSVTSPIADCHVRKDAPSASRGVSGSSESANGRDVGSQKKARRESKSAESPIYISSTPSTPMVDKKPKDLPENDEIDCIDLTDSPSPVKTQARMVSKREKENIAEKSLSSTPTASAPPAAGHSAGALKPKKPRTKEERLLQRQKEVEAAEKREEERRKKRVAEKKMMPLGAEDSDEADVRPLKGYKKPDGSTVTLEHDSGIRDTTQPPVTQLAVPTIDFNAIRTRQATNEKESKAKTRIKRRPKPLSIPTGSISGASTDSRPPLSRAADGERPSKRARTQSEGVESTVSGTSSGRRKSVKTEKPPSSASSVGKGKAKENGTRRKRQSDLVDLTFDEPSSPIRTKWPVKRDDKMHDKNFIECDSCHTWYHNGCVGIRDDDVRLKETEIFACPPCLAGRDPDSCKPPEETCGRPDCIFKRVSGNQGEYFVKRIIGKRIKVEGGRGGVEEYLVEWDGYPIGEATWEKESFMVDPSRVIRAFAEAAQKEGLDLDPNPFMSVLLRDAKRCGWREDDL
ncbi:hypothetical protein D9756_006536 [Leucocoprinus leucothites]|uniref:Chromo domain-containing protein n=1 Tax=Leucocoprinus leucothites TaxID=201217 RepID=A0A8H5G2A7_9AGAR|nr:hypothetical protein D9756_006536 [Leucoagaricus leucothites]